jgi:hypothetical protein
MQYTFKTAIMKKNIALVLMATAFMQIPVNAQLHTTGIIKTNPADVPYQKQYAGLNDTAISKATYLKKSKTQRTVAWAMLGGGAAMTIIGGGLFANNFELFSRDNDDAAGAGVILFLCGVGSSLGSIPFFISAAHNKKNAARISINQQQIYLPQSDRSIATMQPAIKLTIKW